ncbi:MAG: glycosyltransferase [Solirubrobacterales bacterium]|nr:glycosyltransferase [Solirubrobacterales bacterium]
MPLVAPRRAGAYRELAKAGSSGFGAVLAGFELGLLTATLYQLFLLLAAVTSRRLDRATPEPSPPELRFLVIIPAHNEAAGIEAMLASVAAVHYPPELMRVIVIADNCTDDTAQRASSAGAEVLERVADERGKGHALTWALQRVMNGSSDFDAVMMIDADCVVSTNLLSEVERGLRDGANAVQAGYLVDNPLASHATALRYTAFTVLHSVRPLGKEQLGLSCGLWGTGMAFTRELLERQPWSEVSLAEDAEYHLRLVENGERVVFARHAWVRSPMPNSLRGAVEQRARWEKGKVDLARQWPGRLMRSGLKHRDPVRLDAALEHLVPPQSLISAASAAIALIGALMRRPLLVSMSLMTLVAQAVSVLGSLAFVRAPWQVYRSLLFVPELIAEQVQLYFSLARGRGPGGWVRTTREP